jgi:hypothetical protein
MITVAAKAHCDQHGCSTEVDIRLAVGEKTVAGYSTGCSVTSADIKDWPENWYVDFQRCLCPLHNPRNA